MSGRTAPKTHRPDPADGFQEWKREGTRKEPHDITLREGGLFAFAGPWKAWQDRENGEVVPSCTVITTEANELIRPSTTGHRPGKGSRKCT